MTGTGPANRSQAEEQAKAPTEGHEQKQGLERTSMRIAVVADRGSATIWVLAVGVVIVLVGAFGAALGAARMARQQARVAADFGALAGAGHALDGEAVACGTAGELARANGARLAACRLDGLDVLVSAQVTVSPLPWLTRTVTATARAGPVRS